MAEHDRKAVPDEDPTLNELYERVKTLALRKARAMEGGDDDTPEFDRGARTLGTLLRTASLAKQLKHQDTEERRPDDGDDEILEITAEQIRAFKRSVEEKLDRIEAEDRAAQGDRGGDPNLDSEAHAL
ncbi:MAG: hypothetical protein ACE5FO_09905 [Parvularculaceae bacterium]